MTASDRELAKEKGREDLAVTHGVRLERVVKFPFGRSKTNVMHRDSTVRAYEQEHVDARGALAPNVLGGPTVPMAFEIAKRLFDLHTHSIRFHDDTSRIGKRGSEDPRLT